MAEKIRRTKGTFKVAGFANGAERNKFIFEKLSIQEGLKKHVHLV